MTTFCFVFFCAASQLLGLRVDLVKARIRANELTHQQTAAVNFDLMTLHETCWQDQDDNSGGIHKNTHRDDQTPAFIFTTTDGDSLLETIVGTNNG